MINVSENLPLRTIKVKIKVNLLLRSGYKRFSCITRARCIDAKTVKCARLALLSILNDKNRRDYQQLSIFARLLSISTGVK